ncbi:MAG: FtsX-like permease family protein [Lentimicrobiaceae bacterium]|nr:FtsX-like permease family protein [Lentimicrobiaceae bacterium]
MYIKNFITLLKRYTTSSLLNIIGMSVAFAAIYLISVQVRYDLSFNRVIPNSENIYRLELPDWYEEGRWTEYWNRQTPDELCYSIPEIEAAGTIITYPVPEEYLPYDYSIKRNQTIDNIRIKLSQAEREGLEVFPFEFVEGGLEDFVSEGDFIISEEVAKKFDLKVGDVLNLGRGLATDQTHRIVGIFRNFPKPSNIAVCEGWSCMESQDETPNSNWGYSFYIRLKDGMSPDEVTEKMISQYNESLRKEGYSEEEVQWNMKRVTPRLNPLSELYFAEDISSSGFKGSRSTTRTLIAIAVLILVISFINFVNFFFALIPTRIKAINTYKVFGAPTSKLRINIVFETLGLTLLSILGAMLIVFTFANTPLSEYISASVSLRENWDLALAMILFLMAFAFLISLYPAFYITKFNPALVMKGSFHATKSGKVLRYSLVGIQYIISISLIICSLFIQRQHKYMLKYEMGFDKEMLYTIEVPHSALGTTIEMDYTRRDALTDRLKQNPNIIDVTYGDGTFVNFVHMGWGRDYKGQTINFMSYPVSWNFLQMMGIKIEEGRDFIQSDEQLLTGAYIFNREAADRFGIDLEAQIKAHTNELTPVVGICENFNFQPLQYGIEPFAFIVFGQYGWRHPNHAYIRVAADTDYKELSKYIKGVISEFAPNVSVEQNELIIFDDELAIQYQIEDKLATLVTMFSFLSIMISIIGVFGLVLFETQYKRREIGIRRIHGASAMGILKMFNKKYLYIVAICSAVAIPISYYIIDRWMQQFVYRTEMSVWVYVVAVLTITIITVATVSLRSWKAANENPSISINN